MSRTRWILGALLLAGCAGPSPDAVEAGPGEPLPGLTTAELARFSTGHALFTRPFRPEDGLGPIFNGTQCSSCHDLPTSGGHGAEPVRKATRWDPETGCDLLTDMGGDLFQQYVTPEARAAGLVRERIPDAATGNTRLLPPSLYGLGLVDAIPRADIAKKADPDDADGDGISGRVGRTVEGTAGLFGQKESQATVASFIEDATRGEIGLTTPMHPVEHRPGGAALPPGVDPTPEPEVDAGFLDAVTDYVRFLAPPAEVVPDDAAERAAVKRGRRDFESVGCTSCHTPTWTTGPDTSPALANRRFRAFSDFLLHDMGPALGDICGPGASPSEWRTARLVGLHLRTVFLHDGRAQSVEAAIEAHGGEAAAAREAFRSLSPQARKDLLRYLSTL